MFNFIASTISSNFIPLILSGIIFVILLWWIIKIRKVEYIIYFFMIWFPIESLVINYTPIEWYPFLKYFPEVVLYTLLIILFCKKQLGQAGSNIPHNLRLPFGLLVISLVLSGLFNWYNPTVWLLGVRQIVRFASVFLIILFAGFQPKVRKHFMRLAFYVIAAEVLIGFIQFGAQGRLDAWLFSSRAVTLDNSVVLGGNDLFWTPGTRIFATMGRYDQLGSFIMIGLLLIFPWVYKNRHQERISYALYWGVGLIGLVLTSSRASWLGVLAGILAIAQGLFGDKKIWYGLGIGAGILSLYLIFFAATHSNISNITERTNQGFAERILEAGSLAAWRDSYDGYGRIFFIINTPRIVVADSPFFGVGPGNYGGGVAAALLNTQAYDRLHLPFGVQNTVGQIDNSWFSLWGELGTVGLGIIIWIMFVMSRDAKEIYHTATARGLKLLAASFFGLTAAVVMVGFFGPYLEFRTLMFYFWLFAGVLYTSAKNETGVGNFLLTK